ncbi:hypothetical protein NE865_13111 [Phthorimaea operculella]|nr:hypothetical protein NE865_13111 [Phthorimaea operculella]
MTCCVFDKCCCCIDLRTGCLILGYLSLIEEIFVIGAALYFLMSNNYNRASQEEAIFIYILLFVMLFFFIVTIVLLVGIHKNKRSHVGTYLCVGAVCLVGGLISIVVSCISSSGPEKAQNIIKNIVGYLFNVYFYLVIRSYYYKMNNDVRGPPLTSTYTA